jgi:hypothetical protein
MWQHEEAGLSIVGVDDDSSVLLGEAVDTARLLRWMLIVAGLLIDGTAAMAYSN